MTPADNQVYDSALELIGNTPIVRLNRLAADADSEVLVKLEYLNPTGSIKDRIALEMINQAEKEGALKKGDTIIESSTGNTGISLAAVGKLKGYKVVIYETMPGKAGYVKTKIMRNLGADVKLMEPESPEGPGDRSIAGAEVELPGRQRCLDLENTDDKTWWARQFSNEYNTKAHHKTAEEILEQTGYRVDVFVASIGTGGTLFGVAEVLKQKLPLVKIIGIQPASSKTVLSPGMDYQATEIKGGIISEMLNNGGVIDEIVRVSDRDARDMAHSLWKEEGLYAGVSSGANVHIALQEAKKHKNQTVVTVLPDRIDRYITEERFVT